MNEPTQEEHDARERALHQDLEDISEILVDALKAPGPQLADLGGMTGEEQVIDGSIQIWRPGDKDIDGNIVPVHAAQMVVTCGPDNDPRMWRVSIEPYA